MTYRLCMQPAHGHTEGVLAYVVYKGCCDFALPWLLTRLVTWRQIVSSKPTPLRRIGGASMPWLRSWPLWLRSSVSSWHRMWLRFWRLPSTLCLLARELLSSGSDTVMRRALCSFHWDTRIHISQKRWGTLEKACQAVGCMYASFPAALNQLSFFVRVKDQTLVQHMRQSVATPKFTLVSLCPSPTTATTTTNSRIPSSHTNSRW